MTSGIPVLSSQNSADLALFGARVAAAGALLHAGLHRLVATHSTTPVLNGNTQNCVSAIGAKFGIQRKTEGFFKSCLQCIDARRGCPHLLPFVPSIQKREKVLQANHVVSSREPTMAFARSSVVFNHRAPSSRSRDDGIPLSMISVAGSGLLIMRPQLESGLSVAMSAMTRASNFICIKETVSVLMEPLRSLSTSSPSVSATSLVNSVFTAIISIITSMAAPLSSGVAGFFINCSLTSLRPTVADGPLGWNEAVGMACHIHSNSRGDQPAHPVQAPCLKRGPVDSGPTSPRREASLFNSGPAVFSPKSPAGPSFPGWLLRLRDLAIYLNFQTILCVLFCWFVMAPSVLPAAGLVLTLCAMVPPYRWAGLWDPFTRSGGGNAGRAA